MVALRKSRGLELAVGGYVVCSATWAWAWAAAISYSRLSTVPNIGVPSLPTVTRQPASCVQSDRLSDEVELVGDVQQPGYLLDRGAGSVRGKPPARRSDLGGEGDEVAKGAQVAEREVVEDQVYGVRPVKFHSGELGAELLVVPEVGLAAEVHPYRVLAGGGLDVEWGSLEARWIAHGAVGA